MRIGALIVALLAASAPPSALAKATNGHHPHHAGAVKTTSHGGGPGSRNDAAAAGANHESVGDSFDVDGAAVPMPSRDSGRNVKLPKLQIVKPDSASTPRIGVLNPWKPPVRNAIGQAAGPSVNARADGWERGNKKTPQTEFLPGQSGYGAGSIAGVKPIAPFNESATIASRGKIDGTTLIRPTVTAAVGGPAKPTGGINGTLMRPKHR